MCPATDKDVGKINDELRKQLRPLLNVSTDFGPKYLIRIELSDKVAELSKKGPDSINGILEAIKTGNTDDERNESGSVEVGGEKYCWWFKYWDSTHHFYMPNGQRELIIAHESEVE